MLGLFTVVTLVEQLLVLPNAAGKKGAKWLQHLLE